ncbi:MAG TPA: leucine-rich repeat domain-containing protein [Candidatus Nanoarchaeia archaeon]|nr:leucine-rich repeat domain-containing protein [Candidatus Nanoarchaeia archaeon]
MELFKKSKEHKIELDYITNWLKEQKVEFTSDMTILDVRDHNISELPTSISKLTKIKELYASDNHISAIPATICELKELKILNLGSNLITELPESTGKLKKIKMINLSNNKLKTVPSSLCEILIDNNGMISVHNNELATNSEDEYILATSKDSQYVTTNDTVLEVNFINKETKKCAYIIVKSSAYSKLLDDVKTKNEYEHIRKNYTTIKCQIINDFKFIQKKEI